MNVFFISPGRTATTALAHAFQCVENYTSLHESRVQLLGEQRLAFPENHFEFDNRLIFFLADLTQKYAPANGILVIVNRDHEMIAKSYNKRWAKINIMKAWSQGIHLRGLAQNNYEVALDFVKYCYRQLDYFRGEWEQVIEINIDSPYSGVNKLLTLLGHEEHIDDVCRYLSEHRHNLNQSQLRNKVADLRFNIQCTFRDLIE